MKLSRHNSPSLGPLLYCFLERMHRYDAGRTLPILNKARLTTPQLAALEFTRVPRTVSAVATCLGLSRPATSQLIDRLVRERLVRRTENANDRRVRTILLSAKGRALIDRIGTARAERFDSALAVLSPAVATRFASILEVVLEGLGNADYSTRKSKSRRQGGQNL